MHSDARFDEYETPDFRSTLGRLFYLCVIAVGIFLFVKSAQVLFELKNFIGLIGLPIGLALLFGGGYLLSRIEKKYEAAQTARRDAAAIKLFNSVRSGDVQKFAVFLRPFYIKDEAMQTTTIPTGQNPGMFQVKEYPLEEAIIKALYVTMPVVALGKPGETFGVGRILVDENSWRRDVSELMRRASLIICVPSSHPGTKWELNEIIRNNYFSKTVFIMPPDGALSSLDAKEFSQRVRKDWDLLQQQMAAIDIRIPNYRHAGLLFSVDQNHQCVTKHLDLWWAWLLKNNIKELTNPVAYS